MKLTTEEKQKRKEERKRKRTEEKELSIIQQEKTQKPIRALTITIEWKKSRVWGNNPHAEAEITFKDGLHRRITGFSCSGCGYDKESTVIANIFNSVLKYKLYQKHNWKDVINGEGTNYPYGVYYYNGDVGEKYSSGYIRKPCFNGGVGVSCYYNISKFIGGKFEKIVSGKSFDVYKYTDLNN